MAPVSSSSAPPADDPVFGPWHDLMKLSDADFTAEASTVLARWSTRPAGTTPGQVNPLVAAALSHASIKTRADVPRVYGELIRRIYEESRKTPASAGTAEPTEADKAARQIARDRDRPREPSLLHPRARPITTCRAARKTPSAASRLSSTGWSVKAAGKAAPRAMVLIDAAEPYDPRVFVRGNPAQPGERVPRQFLRVLAGDHPTPFTHGSGRLDLARAITAADNPLTSRVIVNRVWMHHFGEPLVSTPSDFGTRSNPPTHPELLDDLAARFMQGGWSLKTLHRHHHALEYLPAGQPRPARLPQARPREPAALAVQPPPARPGGDARHAARRLGPARRDHAGPSRGCRGRPQDHPPDRLRAGRSPEPARRLPGLRLRQPRPLVRAQAAGRPCPSKPSSA